MGQFEYWSCKANSLWRITGHFKRYTSIHSVILGDTEYKFNTVQPFSKYEVQAAQQPDSVTGQIFVYRMRIESLATQTLKGEGREFETLIMEWRKIVIRADGTMQRRNQTKWQLVLPEVCWSLILMSCINEMCHLGKDRPLKLIKDCFFWPNMQRSKPFWHKFVQVSKEKKAKRKEFVPGVNIEITPLFHLASFGLKSVLVYRHQYTCVYTLKFIECLDHIWLSRLVKFSYSSCITTWDWTQNTL